MAYYIHDDIVKKITILNKLAMTKEDIKLFSRFLLNNIFISK